LEENSTMNASARLLRDQPFPKPWDEVITNGWLDLFTIPCWHCTVKYLVENPEAVLSATAPVWPMFIALPEYADDLGVFGCKDRGCGERGGDKICFGTATVEAVVAAWNRSQLVLLLSHPFLLETVSSIWSLMARQLRRDAQELNASAVEAYQKEIQEASIIYRTAMATLATPTQLPQPSAEPEER
jgi:hypothetical protein